MEQNLHPIQSNILRNLLFNPEARFSDLNMEHLPTDQFTFHLKRLMELELIEKINQNHYHLTLIGKEYAGRFDTDQRKVERQAKIGVALCAVKKEGRVKRYLIQQRLKQPYWGYHGFPTGKIRWGETIIEAAARELKEETGLTADLSLVGAKHKMDYSQEGNLLEDKIFFVFRATNCRGTFLETIEGGKNFWLTEKEIFQLPNLFDGFSETFKIEATAGKNPIFLERKYKVSGY